MALFIFFFNLKRVLSSFEGVMMGVYPSKTQNPKLPTMSSFITSSSYATIIIFIQNSQLYQ